MTVTGTAIIAGIPACAFSLNGTGSIEDNGNTLRLPYSGTTCLGPVSGSEVLRRPAPAAPAPAPEPTPAGTDAGARRPRPPPTSHDAIDLRLVTVTGPPIDIASWPATATLTTLDFGRVTASESSSPRRTARAGGRTWSRQDGTARFNTRYGWS